MCDLHCHHCVCVLSFRSSFTALREMLKQVYPSSESLHSVGAVRAWLRTMRGDEARQLRKPVNVRARAAATEADSSTPAVPAVLIVLQDPGEVDLRANSARVLAVDTLARYFKRTASVSVMHCVPFCRCDVVMMWLRLRFSHSALSLSHRSQTNNGACDRERM